MIHRFGACRSPRLLWLVRHVDTGQVAESVTAPTPLPDAWVPAVTAGFAVLVTISAVVPQVTHSRRLAFGLTALTTVVHEAGHALVSCLTGGGVYVIRMFTAGSGMTWYWYPSWWSSFLTSLAGYAAPPLAGLGAASLLACGHAPMVLALTATAMVFVLIVARGAYAVVSVLAVGIVALATLYWGPTWLQQWVAYTETWLLLLGELGGLWALVHNRILGLDADDDAWDLAALTRVPSLVWILAWTVLIGWTVWSAFTLLML